MEASPADNLARVKATKAKTEKNSKKKTRGRKATPVDPIAAKKFYKLRKQMSVLKAAKMAGLTAAIAYRLHRAKPPEIVDEPYQVGNTAADREIIILRDDKKRLRAALRAAHKESIDARAIKKIIGSLVRAKTEPPRWLLTPGKEEKSSEYISEVPMTIWSDWHAGETISLSETNGLNAYSIAIMEKRVQRLVERTIHLCRRHASGKIYPGIVVNLLGDFVSGGLHPELLATDELNLLPSVLHVRDILVWALNQLIDEFGSVYVPCAAGNHGRMTRKPEYKEYVFKNCDWMLYQLLIRHYADSPFKNRIVINVPDSNEVYYKVYGTRVLAMHGDMLGVKGGDGIIGAIGPIMRGSIKTGRQYSAVNKPFDYLLMGHWHYGFKLPNAIVANSLCGFNEYAKNVLRAPHSIPSQPLTFFHPRNGMTVYQEVLLEDQLDDSAGTDWVTFNRWTGEGMFNPVPAIGYHGMTPPAAPTTH